jgi:hypothetical protein
MSKTGSLHRIALTSISPINSLSLSLVKEKKKFMTKTKSSSSKKLLLITQLASTSQLSKLIVKLKTSLWDKIKSNKLLFQNMRQYCFSCLEHYLLLM